MQAPKSTLKKKKVSFDTILGIPYYLLLIIFVLIPLIIMVLYAFTKADSSIFNIRFTFVNFTAFFSEKIYINTLLESIWIAILSTIVSLLISYPLAYIITKLKKRTQLILVLLITANMWINSLILIHALKNIFLIAGTMIVGNDANSIQKAMFLGHDYSLVTGMVFLYFPYMFLPIYTQMTKIDINLLEGAEDLGANKLQIVTKVVFPLTLSSVISSCLIVLLPATTTLVVSQIMGNGKREMIGNLIEAQISNFGKMAAYSIILGLAMILIVLILKKFDKYDEVLANEE